MMCAAVSPLNLFMYVRAAFLEASSAEPLTRSSHAAEERPSWLLKPDLLPTDLDSMVDMRAEDDLSKALFSCFRLSYTAIFDRCCERVNAPVEVIDDVAARIAAAVANFMVVI